MRKKILVGLAAVLFMFIAVTMAGATTITTNSSFTARLIGGLNVLVGDSGGREGTVWNYDFLSVKEGTSDRVCLEYFIGDLTVSPNVIFNFNMSNMDDPMYSNLSLYAYEANGLANASDYYNTDTYITTFSDFGASGTNAYSLNITNILELR